MRTKKRGKCDKFLVALIGWLLLWLVANIAGVRLLLVHGNSMQPTLEDGDLIVGLTVQDSPILEHGDVITFYPAPDSRTAYVKRVIGLSGETVEAQGDLLFVNGKSDGISRMGTGTWGPITVPPNTVFVLGDNRAVSCDSRTIGCIPLQQVCVKVIGKSSMLS